MIRSYTTEGVVLKRINFGEADRIITLFTKHYGKIRVVAKGIRRLTSRKGGNLELFRHVALSLAKSKNLDLITEVQTLNSYSTLRHQLVKIAVAYYLCELVDKLTAENQENRVVYELLLNSLNQIDTTNLKQLIRTYEEKLLDCLGFGVPDRLRRNSDSLRPYIETITERKISSPAVLHDLCT